MDDENLEATSEDDDDYIGVDKFYFSYPVLAVVPPDSADEGQRAADVEVQLERRGKDEVVFVMRDSLPFIVREGEVLLEGVGGGERVDPEGFLVEATNEHSTVEFVQGYLGDRRTARNVRV